MNQLEHQRMTERLHTRPYVLRLAAVLTAAAAIAYFLLTAFSP